ncbi:MAG: bifunctional diguanylate cyclase/phosphodiesterase [Pseudorhodoplanes sp.]|nr:bifunctional diguanylate cyclase/phosphodiesterase [Pseudorhodoplanes sp.]
MAALDLADILRSAGAAAYEWCLETDGLAWTPNAPAILGIRDAAAIVTNRGFEGLLDAGTARSRTQAVLESKGIDHGAGVPYQVEYCIRISRRSPKLWIEDVGRWFAGPDGRPEHAHGIIRGVNERHAREQQLAFLSRFDALTGEVNRWHLTETLGKILQETLRARSSCGFLLVAIDNLGRINASFGYEAADEIIRSVARRLRAQMRGDDFIGRFSGNKFGIILNDCTPEDIAVAADRFSAGIRGEVFQTSMGPIAITATLGGVTAPRHANSVREILSCAQEALGRAKAKRPGSFLAYSPSAERETLRQENVRSTDEIVGALNERRVLLAYELAVDTQTRQPAFHECLMRIRRADGSLIPAAAVVPAAERLGLVRMLDHRVLELVVDELTRTVGAHVSLNVSPASTADPDWWKRLDALLRAHPGVGERMIIEITEMAAIRDVDETRGFVARAKDLGCRIAIDDFGAGYTSLRNLRKLGVDMVKIDGSFVQNLTRSGDDRAFVRTLVELGRRLNLKTVAEWVQDEQSSDMLENWGCDYLQGALIGRATIELPSGQAVAPHPKSAAG